MEIVIRQEAVAAKLEFGPEIHQWLLDNGFILTESSYYDNKHYKHKTGLKITLREKKNSAFPYEFELSYTTIVYCDGKGNATLTCACPKEKDWLDGCAVLDSELRRFTRAVKVAKALLAKISELSEGEQ